MTDVPTTIPVPRDEALDTMVRLLRAERTLNENIERYHCTCADTAHGVFDQLWTLLFGPKYLDINQTEIEQLQGQQKVLNDQTSYAALSVDVAQQGATQGPPPVRTGLAKAWDDSRHGFTNGVEWLLARSGTALLVLLVLAALIAVGRVGWENLRRRLI